MSDSTMEEYLDNPWATREEHQQQQASMTRRQYEEKQRAHEAAMYAQQQTAPGAYAQQQQADPAVEDLGARFSGLGYLTQRDIEEQRMKQERIRRLRAQQDAGNDLHRQMGGSGWGGGGAWGGGGRGRAWNGDRAFDGGSGGLGGGWGPRMDQPHPMRFPESEPSVNITEWMVKHHLKMNDVPRFDGQIGLENLRKWHMDVEHFAKIAGLSEMATINLAWTRFGSSVLEWFQDALWKDFGIAYLPQHQYPFSWEDLKAKMTDVFAPAFSSTHVWKQLSDLKRKHGYEGTKSYITRFLELAKTPYNVCQGDCAWEILYGNLSSDERLCVNTICVQNAELRRRTTMQTILNSVDQTMLATAAVGAAVTTTPMDLTALSKAGDSKKGDCSRCGGVGHWAWKCGTPRNWKPGQKIDKPPRGEGDKKLNNTEATLEETANSEETAGKA
ncbi:hypothetical protein FN846DRAFT_954908 [Sphaerosporella brunnea]|uniref:CCHC-type domain-containing protein n=1 Tax=Sphaerosporella brunnea TaxID=1250544 RepID=A0A5J5ETI8_9PEZI|nr:hypothetical protein FN846DRAFT_954908 [Sphaerosporella brunnea]